MAEVPVRVWRVGRNSESQYLLVLRDEEGNDLAMTIGPCEAFAIWAALKPEALEELPRRPGTHDLLCALMSRLGGRLTKVVIDDLWNEVYFAKLHLAVDGETITVDTRPSDAVALALRVGAPLYAVDAVMDAAAGDSDAPGPPPDPGPTLDLDDL